MKEQKTKHIYIMLTRSGLPISSLMQKLDLGFYTHSCLAFDEHLVKMYSFGTLYRCDPYHTGLKRESIYRDFYAGKPYIPVKVLEIPVTPKQYCNMCRGIHWVKEHHDQFKFNTVGMIYNIFKIDRERPGHFFCSEFIYMLLREVGLVDFHKPRHFVLPDDFLKLKGVRVMFDGQLIALQSQLAPYHGKDGEPFLFEKRFEREKLRELKSPSSKASASQTKKEKKTEPTPEKEPQSNAS